MEITQNIHALKTPLGQTQDRFVHVFLIYGDNITLIDTGLNGSEKLITEYILSTGRDPSEIGLIIFTHSHPDHIGSAKAIHDLTGCNTAAHPLDSSGIESIDPMLLKSPAPGVYPLVGGPVPISRILNDGNIIRLGEGISLEVLHTPGHTPGSISLLLREEMVLFTGDTVWLPGRAPIYSDPVLLVQSIRKMEKIAGIRYFLPGHDIPAKTDEGYRRFQDSIAYIKLVHATVKRVGSEFSSLPDMQALADRVLNELGIASGTAPTFITRTFLADLNADDPDGILNE